MRVLPSLSLPVLFAAGSDVFSAFNSSEELCQDETAAAQCNDKCAADFAECYANCSDQNCQYECVAEFGRCGPACPCGENCPGGCEGCPSPFCQCTDILNNGEHNYCMHRATAKQDYCVTHCETDTCVLDCSQEFLNEMKQCPCRSECVGGCPCKDSSYECREYAMILDNEHRIEGKMTSVDGEVFERRRYGPRNQMVLDKAFYFEFKEQVFMYGGASTPRQIAFFTGPPEAPCHDEIDVSDLELGYDFDQVNGTAVLIENEVGFEDDVIYFCFGHKDTACFEFDGENSVEIVLETSFSHRRGGVGIFQNEVFAVGGVNADGSLNNKAEILGRNGWTTIADFPEVTGISDVAVVSDLKTDKSFILGGHNGDNAVQDIHVFGRNDSTFEFTWIGRLSRRMSQVSSLMFENHILLVGETIERVEIEDDASYGKGYHVRELDPPLQYPVLFATEPDVCLNSCKEFCFAGDLW